MYEKLKIFLEYKTQIQEKIINQIFQLKTNLNSFFSSKTFINKMIEERYLIYPFKLN